MRFSVKGDVTMEDNLIEQEIRRREEAPKKGLPEKIRERLEKMREARRARREKAISKLEERNDRLQKDAQQVQRLRGLKKEIRTSRRTANPFGARIADSLSKARKETSGLGPHYGWKAPARRQTPRHPGQMGKRSKLSIALGGGSMNKFFGAGKGGMRKWI
jgi:hypothetical protein